jgi:hypothetical protein
MLGKASEIKKYIAIAKGDCEAEPHSWSDGLDYEMLEGPTRITLASNEGHTYYRPEQKEKLEKYFNFVEEESA